MTDGVLGLRLNFALYIPGEGTIGETSGTVVSREVRQSEVRFHDGLQSNLTM
jgi:hypothetical protein